MSHGTLFTFDGAVMRPQYPRLAAERFEPGETYLLADVEARSDLSHKHEFAWLREAWKTLPEDLSELYPTEKHLRKRALITAGYYDEEIVDAGSAAAALRVASFSRKPDDFALIFVRGPFVIRRTAKSQSKRAMGAKDFQASKTAIMEIVAGLLGVTVAQLPQMEAA